MVTTATEIASDLQRLKEARAFPDLIESLGIPMRSGF
jgi:hypothetical protein